MERDNLNYSDAQASQGPAAAPVLDEIATVARDPKPRAFNGVFVPTDETLAARGGAKGYALYDEIERDGHAYAVLQKRRMAVIARDWVVEPASDAPRDQEAAEVVRAQLAKLGLDKVTLDLLDGTLKGFAVGEVMWKRDGAAIVAHKVIPRGQHRFTFDAETGKPRLLTRDAMLTGIELPERKFLVYSFGGKDESPFGLGLGTRLYWYAWFKRQIATGWLVYVDKFASPTVVGEYQPGTPLEQQRKLLQAAQAVAQEAAVVIPQGLVLKLMEAARTGGADAYERFLRYCDEMISEIVLGETLSTSQGTGKGSQAATETHNEVRKELAKADADLVSGGPVAELAGWITDFNVPGANPPTVYRVFPEDLTARATRDGLIRKLGFKPTADYIERTYGDGWEPETAAAPQADAAPAFAESPEPDVVDDIADRAGAAAGEALAGLIDPVRQLAARAGSLAELRDGVGELAGEQDATAFGELMQQAMTAAHLAGRFEVLDGR